MTWFKKFTKYDGRDEVVVNEPRVGGEKVVLSNCRGLGPSYRLLPRVEKHRPCSGRDELCHQVLNDEWASHPTWASEDSGFIAHRKNSFEETLHRTEEERHDYDFNIEACLRTIQLMEPIAQQLKLMSDDERAGFDLPRGMGGQSHTIYERVVKKVYGRDYGKQVLEDMFNTPSVVLPILLRRLKQKAEEWKASQVRSSGSSKLTWLTDCCEARMGKGLARADAQDILESPRSPRPRREKRRQAPVSAQSASHGDTGEV